ncbi:hypothetical protein A5686_14555 [Mycobacterium sp. E2479]|nr:hypothetical protein A5686_14555 [Mycobacterium sp. E2479]
MASNGPRDDFHNQPTQHGDFGAAEQPPTGQIPSSGRPPNPPEGFEQPGDVDPFDQEAEPTPWYRRPGMLVAWLVSVVILIALIVFGIIQLMHGQQSVNHNPKTTTSTTTTTTSTTPTTTTPTTAPSSAEEPPAQQPTQQQPPQQQPTGGQTQQPSHHHHLPQLPSVITVPGVPNPVTVPPGLR